MTYADKHIVEVYSGLLAGLSSESKNRTDSEPFKIYKNRKEKYRKQIL